MNEEELRQLHNIITTLMHKEETRADAMLILKLLNDNIKLSQLIKELRNGKTND